MSNKKDLQALAENLVEEFYETQGAGVLKNLWNRAQIIVVLVGLVIIFKEKITEVVNSIFTKITNQTKKI